MGDTYGKLLYFFFISFYFCAYSLCINTKFTSKEEKELLDSGPNETISDIFSFFKEFSEFLYFASSHFPLSMAIKFSIFLFCCSSSGRKKKSGDKEETNLII